VTGLGMFAILLGIMGIVGGAVVNKNTRIAKYLMLISGIFGFVAVSAFWIIAGIMLIIGGILANRKM
jgi:polyferredoxin